jgi:hypothetical protein
VTYAASAPPYVFGTGSGPTRLRFQCSVGANRLTAADRNLQRIGYLLVPIHIHPHHRIFDPGQIEPLERVAEADRLVCRHVALTEMIDAER